MNSYTASCIKPKRKFMRSFYWGLLTLFAALMVSCTSQQKNLNYLQSYIDSTRTDSAVLAVTNPVIQKNDLLSVVVYSASTIPETDALYNLPDTKADEGYLVDAFGYINIPRVGKVKAEGLTKEQLSAAIIEKLNASGELTDPQVMVRFLNYSVTVLGEVSHPGRFQIPNDRVTVLEALGLAGDLTLYGKKEDVTIVREKDGRLEYGKLDLSSKDIVASPYYFLNQNDVVIVNADKNKNRINEQATMQRVSVGLSIITTLSLLYNIFRK